MSEDETSPKVEQIRQLKDVFAQFDMNFDGSLTMLELAALLRSLGVRPVGDQIHEMLAHIDSNGNGSVEFEELVEAILPEMNDDACVNRRQLIEVFHMFDRDGNGSISAAELVGSMAKMGQPLTYAELWDMIREADTNGDGFLSSTNSQPSSWPNQPSTTSALGVPAHCFDHFNI